MRAFTLDSFDAPPGLREDLPPPRPAEGEMLVRVHASSVNPVDAAIAGGLLREMFEHEFPVVLGRDYAGCRRGGRRRRDRLRGRRGGVRVRPQSYPLEHAGEALEALGATHTQGKLGIRVEP